MTELLYITWKDDVFILAGSVMENSYLWGGKKEKTEEKDKI
jgi:hypothetical protein